MLQHGEELWTFDGTETVARKKNSSVIFDLSFKYSRSKADQSIVVSVKTYYGNYRISQMDTTYKITLPRDTDYTTISCGLPFPSQTGAHNYDFEIRDAADIGDAVVVNKAITFTD